MKTSELTGPALDWAVAKCEGHDAHHYKGVVYTTMHKRLGPECNYSTDWAQGGPIIQRERIRLDPRGHWVAGHDSSNDEYSGPTPLVAAMRAYVASKLVDEVEIPEELKEFTE